MIGARHSGLREEVSAAAVEPRRAQTGIDDARLTVQSRPLGYRSLVWPATAFVAVSPGLQCGSRRRREASVG